MKLRNRDYLKAAFHARPAGMFVPPNWVLVAAFVLLGFLSWGYWVMGAGLELAYLFALFQSARFRAYVDAQAAGQKDGHWQDRVEEVLKRLDARDRERYLRLDERCRAVLAGQEHDAAGIDVQQDGLGRLLWLHLRLLCTRRTLRAILEDAGERKQDSPNLERRVQELERKIAASSDEALHRSITTQIEILRQRWSHQDEAARKVAYLDAELERIEQQVELLREQTALTKSTGKFAVRIDAISETLGETMQWVEEQEELFGGMDELVDEQPRLLRSTK